ncbi:hypothetical protein [Mongoliitalea lutea]|uniref:Uncharacterized protein n=1 Tax=Mongoliitalea lutea TaxID=849756 RepID=A0A8J3CYF0_9BACT|nr:hypothetical protein [Mongoliitalea lutea]GHB44286.1 hypothetical protein GCM10008106_26640 [Mongoliitalea lutea]
MGDLLKIEFWVTVINSSTNIIMMALMVLQTYFFYLTFRFGFNFLKDHEQKIKVENKQKLIIESLKILSFLESSYINQYHVSFPIFDDRKYNDLKDVLWDIKSINDKGYDDFTEAVLKNNELETYAVLLADNDLITHIENLNKYTIELDRKFQEFNWNLRDERVKHAYKIIQEFSFDYPNNKPSRLHYILNRKIKKIRNRLVYLYNH